MQTSFRFPTHSIAGWDVALRLIARPATAKIRKCFSLGLPKGKQFAWDTYMAFDRDAAWKDSTPKPNDWMRQLGKDFGRDHPRWLDGE